MKGVGREVIVVVRKAPNGAGYIGEKDSLQTKCPSKFRAADEVVRFFYLIDRLEAQAVVGV